MRGLYLWLMERYPGFCIFFQVGRFFEFYGAQAERYSKCFGLRTGKETRGMGKQCGFPVRMLKSFKNRALHALQPYMVVAERGYCPTGIKKRVITEILIFEGGDL